MSFSAQDLIKNAMLGGRGGSGSSVQPDWNQTDETQPDFIRNKPFGDTLTEIMPETEIVGELVDGTHTVMIDPAWFIGNESALSVTFDGVVYVCKRKTVMGIKAFGNAALLGMDDTGEPFLVFPLMGVVGVFDGDPHTIKITGVVSDKLDGKYVDACSVLYICDDDNYLYMDDMLTVKATLSDLTDAVNGRSLQCVFMISGIVFGIFLPSRVSLVTESGAHGEVAIVGADGKFYTAEYTGE